MDTQLLRQVFGVPSGQAWLNHGAEPLVPQPIRAAAESWRRLERQDPDGCRRQGEAVLEAARERLARWLGTTPEHLLVIPSVRRGVVGLVRWMGLEAGDALLASDQEYPWLASAWRALAAERGIVYRELEPHRLADAISVRTRVLCVSHISCLTSRVLPVEEICRQARARGVTTVVDGAHASLQMPVGLDALGADYYVGSLHKWACLPYGAAFLYARDPDFGPLRWLETGLGGVSTAPLVTYEALEFWEGLGMDAVRDHGRRLVSLARRKVELKPVGVGPMMISFQVPPDVDPLRHGVRGLIGDWRGRSVLRVCFHVYNDEDDVFRLASACSQRHSD